MTARIHVDCGAWLGDISRIWTSIGYDEINWTYSPRGQAVYRKLSEIAERPYFVRVHNTFTSGNSLSQPAWGSTNIYHEMPDGSARYYWETLDQVYDTIIGSGFHLIVEMGFCPRDLVPSEIERSDWSRDVGKENYESDGLWKYPPKDLERWGELVYQFIVHYKNRYGEEELNNWYFEAWNEPDLPNYWQGSLDDFLQLYDYMVAGILRALPEARVGGPASTGPANENARYFLDQFLRHCVSGKNSVTGQIGTQLDFVSFHTKGAHFRPRRYYNPYLAFERESPSSKMMMLDIKTGLEVISRYPVLSGIPVLVNECDPAVGTIYGVYDNPNFNVTNTEYYPNFLCALVKRILDLNDTYTNPIILITSWAFYFEGKRYFEGNRTLVTNSNIEKPVLNAFRMLARLGTTRIKATSDQSRDVLSLEPPSSEVDILATLAGKNVALLIWHQADEWWSEGEVDVDLQILNMPFSGIAQIEHYRIDCEHSNAYAAWMQQGKPQTPSQTQIEYIKSRQQLDLLEPVKTTNVTENKDISLTMNLPLFGTSLLIISPANN